MVNVDFKDNLKRHSKNSAIFIFTDQVKRKKNIEMKQFVWYKMKSCFFSSSYVIILKKEEEEKPLQTIGIIKC